MEVFALVWLTPLWIAMDQSSALSRPSHTSTGHGHHQSQRAYHRTANQLVGSGPACQPEPGAYGTTSHRRRQHREFAACA
jgi:hypothetical protein